MNNETTAASGLNRYFAKIYGLMGLGVGVSALMTYLLLTANPFQPTMSKIVTGFPLGVMGWWLIEFILVIFLSRQAMKNPSMSFVGFLGFSAVNGIVISFTLAYYEVGSVLQAFVAASVMFLAMGATGLFVKKDLSGIAHAAISFLWGAIILSLLNIFLLKSQPVDLFISLASLLIFSGLTAYDHQRIKQAYYQGGATEGLAIFMALQLYLDFINLFLAILRIFGNQRD